MNLELIFDKNLVLNENKFTVVNEDSSFPLIIKRYESK
jgi:hypothetical protein